LIGELSRLKIALNHVLITPASGPKSSIHPITLRIPGTAKVAKADRYAKLLKGVLVLSTIQAKSVPITIDNNELPTANITELSNMVEVCGVEKTSK
jgi:hypothetical protein